MVKIITDDSTVEERVAYIKKVAEDNKPFSTNHTEFHGLMDSVVAHQILILLATADVVPKSVPAPVDVVVDTKARSKKVTPPADES